MNKGQESIDDYFNLYDLRVECVELRGKEVASYKVGDYFEVKGEDIHFPNGRFSMYALAALIPLLPAKQRETHPHDWMTTDSLVSCPDPHAGAIFKITRIGKTTFKHSEVSGEKIENDTKQTN